MRGVRVHVPGPLAVGDVLALPAQAAQHVARVLRLGVGDCLTLFDGRGGEWRATIAAIAGNEVRVAADAHLAIERESPLRIALLQALARGEKMDWVLQKATELGVARVLPIACERSVVQLDGERADRRLAHWQGVVAAACEQCGRNRLPRILPPASLEAVCTTVEAATRLVLAPGAARSLVAAARAAGAGPRQGTGTGTGATVAADADAGGAVDIALLIGPEGGLSPAEIALAQRSGFEAVGLGPRILRTETAAIAALALLQGFAGDLGRE